MTNGALLGAGMIIAVLLIVLSQIKLQRVDDISVLFQCNTGVVREINITYQYSFNEWMSVVNMESFIAKEINVSSVRILSIRNYNRSWKIRRCSH